MCFKNSLLQPAIMILIKNSNNQSNSNQYQTNKQYACWFDANRCICECDWTSNIERMQVWNRNNVFVILLLLLWLEHNLMEYIHILICSVCNHLVVCMHVIRYDTIRYCSVSRSVRHRICHCKLRHRYDQVQDNE